MERKRVDPSSNEATAVAQRPHLERRLEGPIVGETILLWGCLDELASMAELSIAIQDLEEVAPRLVDILEDGRDHFVGLNTPRPLAVELVLTKLARHRAGLDPDRD